MIRDSGFEIRLKILKKRRKKIYRGLKKKTDKEIKKCTKKRRTLE